MSDRMSAWRRYLKRRSTTRQCFKCGNIREKCVLLENANGTEKAHCCQECLRIILRMPGVKVIDSNVGKDV